MKKSAKIISLLLALLMMLSLTACGGKDPGSSSNPPANSDAPTDEVYNINMQIVTFGQEFSGLADVEAAINAITVPEIGASVTLMPVAAWDLTTTSSLEITSGSKLDLICILPMSSGLDSITNYTSKNMIIPLDELIDQYGADIKSCLGELLQIGYSGGSLYAVPANYVAGNGGSFVARDSLLDELGFSFDEGKLYTLADLEPLFAAYKDKYPTNYSIAGFGVSEPFLCTAAVDDLGTDFSDGVLLGTDSTTVVDMFETQEYADYVRLAYQWYQAGYFNPDVATITDDWVSQVAAGNYLGSFISTNGSDGLDGVLYNENSIGDGLTVIKLVDDFATTGKASYGMWAIPVTCENPQKTMQFLNLLYQDRDRANDVDTLIACGIEGVTYEVVEDLGGSRAITKYVDGVNGGNSPYEQTVPIYGNQFNVPKNAPVTKEIYDQWATYNQNLNYSKAFGYSFDATAVSAQKAAVQSVVNQYRAILSFGTVDPDQVLPEFISALKDAGIDDIIAENQKQLDAWMTGK